MTQTFRDALQFPASQAQHISSYLPTPSPSASTSKPHVTLTFATSLDSQLSLAPGIQTALSGPQSKAMTHYLRSKHDAILIGVGTAVADNPSLNCRIEGVGGYGGEGLEGQPRPIVIDPKGRWDFNAGSKMFRLAKEGKGKGPWVVTRAEIDDEKRKLLSSVGGKVERLVSVPPGANDSIPWSRLLRGLATDGIRSIMIEGGGAVINDLLSIANIELVDSVIVTIAPVWLGKGGVQVYPDARVENGQRLPVSRLKNVKWVSLGEDVVLCGHPRVR